jgi:hypothetical protein
MPKTSERLINFKVVIAAILFGLGLLAVLLVILYSAKANQLQVPATAILKIIQAPTQTLPGMPATPSQTPAPTNAQQAQQTPTPNDFIILGNYVKVSGTGGDGLRLHNDASVSSKVNYVAIDAELFIVMGGPVQADGYTWWELKDPYSNEAVGWGVANYLSVVQHP